MKERSQALGQRGEGPTLVLLAGQHAHRHIADVLWIEVSDGVRDSVQGDESFGSVEVAQEPEHTDERTPVAQL